MAACERIAGRRLRGVRGPTWHGFVDGEHFSPVARPVGEQLSVADERLAELRRTCGEQERAEAGFSSTGGLAYGVETNGVLVAAGNMTPFRGVPADVGLLVHPVHRRRGLARALASRMVADALPAAGIVRFRAAMANTASLAVGSALGFVGRGEILVADLRPE